MTRRTVIGIAATALIVLVDILLQVQPYTPDVLAASDWLQLALIVAAGGSTARAAIRAEGQARWFWLGITASILLWGAGQVRYMWTGSALNPGVDYVQVLLFLPTALPILPALALRPDSRRAEGPMLALDVAVGFVLRLRSAVAPWRAVHLELGAATVVWFGGDSIVSWADTQGWYRPGLLDLPWMLPFAWIALVAAPWRPPGEAVPERPPGWAESGRGTVLALFAVAAPGVLHYSVSLVRVLEPRFSTYRTVVTLVASVLLASLFLARQLAILTAFERSERRRDALRRSSEERFTRAFHGVPLGTALVRQRDGRVIDANERCLDTLGLQRADVVERRVMALNEIITPRFTRVPDADVTADGGRPLHLTRSNGEVIDLLAWVRPLEVGHEHAVLVLIDDQRETRRLARQLTRARKTESVGRLAGSVAHDFNNLLTAIGGSVDIIRHGPLAPPDLARELDHVLSAATRAAALTSQLLAYGRGEAASPQVLDVGVALKATEPTLRRLAGSLVTVTCAFPDAPLRVRLDPEEFDRIVVNLLVNARDATPAGGAVLVTVERQDVGAELATRHQVEPGSYAVLVVTDAGHGIAPDILPRVFDPYFTTKDAGKGSGLGLPTVVRTVRQAGGFVDVASTVDVGTSARVYLPETSDEWEPLVPQQMLEAVMNRETLLLVEDEDAVRGLMRTVLERQGYRVIEASSGQQALAVAGDTTIDLLLTDVIMPGMNGPELAAELKKSRPGLRVLYASGYAADALGPTGEHGPAFLPKPFTPDVLARRVRAVLDGGSGERRTELVHGFTGSRVLGFRFSAASTAES